MPVLTRIREVVKSKAVRVVQRARGFKRNTVGGVAATVAILSPALIGGIGLGGEAGYWYLTQRKVQNAADVMAHGAAKRLTAGADQAGLETIAAFLAEQAQIPPGAANIEVHRPPVSGGFVEDNNAVEIVVTETVPRMFSAMYSNDPVPITARAVATARSPGRGCVLALSDTQNNAISVTGAGSMFLITCDLISNGPDVSVAADAPGLLLSAGCVRAAGSAQLPFAPTLDCGPAVQNANATVDPFAGVAEPIATGTCEDGTVGADFQFTTVTPVEPHASGMSAIRYCNGLSLRGNVTLNPGLYIVEGGNFDINPAAFINAPGVTFYLRDGVNLTVDGSAALNLSPPTFGTYAGITVFGSRAATTAVHNLNGNFSTILDGAIYAPASRIAMSGTATTSFIGCTQVIGDTVAFTGSFAMTLHCLFPPAQTIEVAGTAQIVE